MVYHLQALSAVFVLACWEGAKADEPTTAAARRIDFIMVLRLL